MFKKQRASEPLTLLASISVNRQLLTPGATVREATQAVNTVFEYGAPFHLLVKRRWPDASFTLFDVHALLADLMDDPKPYFDEPADAKGFYYQCAGASDSDCKPSKFPMSSFVW